MARYYREALPRQGPMLDCTRTPASQAPPPAGSRALQCGSDRPRAGGHLLKVGVPNQVRMVAIEPTAGGTQLQLVRLDLRGE